MELANFTTAHSAPLPLDEVYYFLRLWTRTLRAEKRWKKYSVSGESMPETELEHIVDKFFFGGQMIAIEQQYGGSVWLELRPVELFYAFFIYGFRVALRGDVALMDLSEDDLRREKDSFDKFLALSPPDTRNAIVRAYDISKEREEAAVRGLPLQAVSTNGQFLWAVVVATFLAKSLYEVSAGNILFVNTFHNMRNDTDFLCRKFYSFKEIVKSQLKMIGAWMEGIPRWEE